MGKKKEKSVFQRNILCVELIGFIDGLEMWGKEELRDFQNYGFSFWVYF